MSNGDNGSGQDAGVRQNWLFWACFAALVTTSFGFIVRAMVIGDWAKQFNLSETQSGEIFGVGLWPFAISIVLFSLVIDRIGYGKAMVFAFVCHVASAIITVCAPLMLPGPGADATALKAGQDAGYWMLYIGNFVVALGNGTVEAVINPVVATMYSREKTKWLNILHAGWPGGLVLGGILAIGMGAQTDWRYKVCLIFLPTLVYGIMLLGQKFPVQERVKAGVPYKSMLQEAGILGAVIVVTLMVREVGRVFSWGTYTQLAVGAILVLGYGAYVKALGRLMFIFLVIIMMPLAITELGTDSWITALMEPEMAQLGLPAGLVLVYTSAIMMIMRFFAGPIVHKLSPLGLLAVSSLVAALGLVALSASTGVAILLAATLYGFGKTFFWPTMLGVVSERFPKGGALTLNSISGVGMLTVGVVGTALLGNIQDKTIDGRLQEKHPEVHAKIIDAEKMSVFGAYSPVNQQKVDRLPEAERTQVQTVRDEAKKAALAGVAGFPVFMLVCYLILILYFRAKGGYKAEVLAGHEAKDERFTGGTEGPGEG